MIFNIDRLKSKENKVLLSNFFSLSALQMATYIFPLITLPYLVRVLGLDIFGLLAMATAVIAYFQVITDYGFDLSATKDISINRENREKVIEIFSSVLSIKFMLMIISLFLLLILIFSFDKLSKNWEIYLLTYGIVIGKSIFPIWFFQGMEKMKYITVLTILSKFIFTISIFIFVQNKMDYWIVPLLYAIGDISTGLLALYIIKRDFDISYNLQKIDTIKIYFKDGWNIFMQRLYVNLHNNMTNILVLGILTNDTVVGIYSISIRIIGIIGEIFKILSRAYYPYFSKKFSEEPVKAFKNLKKMSILIFIFSFLSMILIIFFNKYLLEFISGDSFNPHMVDILNILSIVIIILPFFTLFTNVLVAVDKSEELKIIARDTALLNIIFIFPIVYLYKDIGLAYWATFLQIWIMARYLKSILEINRILKKGDKR